MHLCQTTGVSHKIQFLRIFVYIKCISLGKNIKNNPNKKIIQQCLRSKPQATFVSEAISRLLSHVKDVAVRAQVTELLVEVEAIKVYDLDKEALQVR